MNGKYVLKCNALIRKLHNLTDTPDHKAVELDRKHLLGLLILDAAEILEREDLLPADIVEDVPDVLVFQLLALL